MKTKSHIQYRLKNNKGVRVPGVTTITGQLGLNKQALIKWANNLGLQGHDSTKYRDDKADIGTLAHAFVTDALQGRETNTDDYAPVQVAAALHASASFWDWQRDRSVELIWCEKPLVHEALEYGGTIDIYAEVNGVKEIIDLKTGKNIYLEHWLQVGGGYSMLAAANGFYYDRIRILNIPRGEGETWREEVREDVHVEQEIFEHLLKMYYLLKEIE